MDQRDSIFYRDRSKIYPLIERGEGIYIYDDNGKRYIDATGGPMVVNIGHAVPEVIDAMVQQARKICFAHTESYVTRPQLEFAQKVIEFAPRGMSKVYFVSGGSEATEVALKMVRQYQLERGESSRFKVIGRWEGYHGGTMGALSLTGHKMRGKDYLPYLVNLPHIHAPYCYRCRFGKEYPSCEMTCAYDLERIIKEEGKETIAAFISEPVTGSSLGAMSPPPEYFPIIREICNRYGILLILDEVITGFGRTGKNFGIDHWGVIPDLIVTAKGMSSGYTPLGAVIVHDKVHDVFMSPKRTSFFTGYTYSGNPLSCAVGLAVLRYIEKYRLVQRSADMGNYLLKKLVPLREFPTVGDIRGKGLLIGIELVQDRRTKTPFDKSKKVGGTIVRKSFENGLSIKTGHGLEDVGDILMIAPPFTVTESEIDQIVDILTSVICEVVGS